MENLATGEDVAHDVKRRLVSFNGAKQPHETAPYTGERFTCVWYTSTISPAEGAKSARELARGGSLEDGSDGKIVREADGAITKRIKQRAAALRGSLKKKHTKKRKQSGKRSKIK